MIADDHVPTRAGVRAALEHGGFRVVDEVGSAPAAIEAAKRERPDVCVLDIHMPGSGIRAASEITAALPNTAVVMLTVSTNEADLFDALRAGASGYLLKDMDPDRLPLALEGVLRGEAAIPRRLAARLLDEFRERGQRRRVPLLQQRGVDLTSREWEVFDLLRQGLTTRQIAARLHISEVTVRRHVGAALRKLRVPTREAALKLLRERS